MDKGTFVVSLDLELYWGVRDNRTIDAYRNNLDGVRPAVKEIVTAFVNHKIHATWAVVGFIFYKDSNSLKKDIPRNVPRYANQNLSSYNYIHDAGWLDIPCHFAPELIDFIRVNPFQEIGTHTFSHYYCLEEGCDSDSFRDDVALAVRIGKEKGLTMRSIVFPRNQVNNEFLPLLSDKGITSFRGNEKAWFYNAAKRRDESKFRRAIRLIDSYISVSGHNTYALDEMRQQKPYNIPSSRFLRPVSRKLLVFEKLRLKRIKKAMTYAAKTKRVFHLWWHPHNFGVNIQENMSVLVAILNHYTMLEKKYGMQSLNMGELAYLLGAQGSKVNDEAGGIAEFFHEENVKSYV